MSSKLDQMRNQFRERLNSRPIGETKIHVITVENNNFNNDSKVSKSDYPKNSIPTPIKNVAKNSSIDNQKSFKSLSKVDSNKSNPISVYPRNENLMKTDSNNTRRKVDLDRAEKRWIDINKDEKPKDFSKYRISNKAYPEKSTASVKTEGMACRYCQRRFALSERLEKHESVCMSSMDKSRLRFDSFQQRVKGQPKDYLLIYENSLKNKPKEEQKRLNWRQKHDYCISAIKAAKGQVSGVPTTSEIMASIQQQCAYCKRRFNDDAIKRHLPICAKLYHKQVLKL